jgi:hypothetical protein
MKKIILSMAAAMITAVSHGQFFTNVSYRGAFGQGAGANWMTGWTNFDPRNAVYPGTGEPGGLAGKTRVDVGAATPGGDGYTHITSNTTWTSGNVYYLLGAVAVDAGITLTIQAGTVIRGVDNGGLGTPISVLVISRGATLNAVGTSTNPIIMTSAKVQGARESGDWGGLVLCGRAKVNLNKSPNLGGRNVEGTVTTAPGTASYYGTGAGSSIINDNESSGNIQYLRVEFAGDAQVAAQELNGIMLAGVGRGTTFQYIQVSYAEDDSFEWFGGTVNGKYLVAFGGVDDDFDVDEGFTGNVQFGFILRDPRFYDGTSGNNSNLFEMDNNTTSGGTATSDQTQYSPSPVTACVFSNITAIGPMRDTDADANVSPRFNGGWNARTNPGTAIFNSILIGTKNNVAISNTPTVSGASTVVQPSNWTKLSCDSLILRNSYLGMQNAAAANLVSSGGFAGTAADCQGAFPTRSTAELTTFLTNGTNSNTIEKTSLTAAYLGIASPWFTGTISSVPAQFDFTATSLSFTGVDPTLTAGSPFLGGASFTHPRLGIASLPNLTVSSAQNVFGNYNNVTVTGAGNASFTGNVAVAGTFTVNGGTVNFGANNVQGSGAFTIAAGSTISTSAAGGFANTGNGVTRNSGAKSLSDEANYTFNGTAAQSTGGFWTGGRDVTINNAAGVTLSSAATVGGALNLQAGTFNAGSNLLTINSTASRQGIIDNFSSGYTGSLSATSIKFRRFSGGGVANRNIAPPVAASASTTINSVFVPQGVSCGSLKEFDEPTNSWIPVDLADCGVQLDNSYGLGGPSLMAYAIGNKTFEFSGLPQTGTVTRSITRGTGTVPPAPFIAKGWNALQNPYPSAISWSTFDTPGNLAQSPCIAFVWNSSTSNYGTINTTGVTTGGANNNVAPGQGLLIRRGSVGTGNINFDNSMRVSGTTQTFIRQSFNIDQEIRMTLTGNGSEDEIMVGSGSDLQNVDKLFSPSEEAVSLFMPVAEEPLTTFVTHLSDNVIPVSVKIPANGYFTLKAGSIKGLPANAKVIVEDKFMNTFSELTEGSAYTFAGKTTDANRFAIHVQSSATSNGSVASTSLVYANGKTLSVKLTDKSTETSMVWVRDLSGKTVASFQFNGNELNKEVNVSAGIYTVTFQNGTQVKTQKVIFGNN